jgi:uncharacterized membrane protein YjgN (DUF898 family)
MHELSFHGDGGTLFGLTLVNLLLSIVTLGIYYFWGKTRVRAYTHSQLAFDGDRFAYHGTGKELLIGWLKAFAVAVVVFGSAQLLLLTQDLAVLMIRGLVIWLAFLILTPIALVGSRRYRLSRASWRGIRFSFRGRTGELVKLFVGGSVLTTLTLGLYTPFFWNNLWGYLIRHSYFGSQPFAFDGRGKDLFWKFVVALLLTIPTLGLCWAWYHATRQRYYWAHTSFGGAGFRSTVTGGALLGLWIVNILLVVFTLGFGMPWVIVRNLRFLSRYVTLEGALDLSTVRQEMMAASATGEGFADFLGLDFMGLVPN